MRVMPPVAATRPPLWLAGRRRPGQAALEFSLVVLIFLGLLMAIFEGARLAASYFALANAAREGTHAGRFIAVTDDNTIRQQVQAPLGLLPWISPSDLTIEICRHASPTAAVGSSCDTTGLQSGTSVIDVTVSWTFNFFFFPGGWLGQSSKALTGYQRARIE
jgi:Flp pilus assembly protein TadG